MSDPTDAPTTDPDAWDASLIRQEVAFCLSPSGRLRRDDREVAFALEIERLRGELHREEEEVARLSAHVIELTSKLGSGVVK